VQTWQAGQGVAFYLRTDQAGIPFDLNLFGGKPDAHTTYLYRTQTPPESVNNWTRVEVRWADILRAEWEENPGVPFNPSEVTGFAFGLSTPEQSRLRGTLWVDDLSLLGTIETGMDIPPAALPMVATSAPEQPRKPLLPCSGAIALPLSLIVGLCLLRRKRK
jgi:hypothetical protein